MAPMARGAIRLWSGPPGRAADTKLLAPAPLLGPGFVGPRPSLGPGFVGPRPSLALVFVGPRLSVGPRFVGPRLFWGQCFVGPLASLGPRFVAPARPSLGPGFVGKPAEDAAGSYGGLKGKLLRFLMAKPEVELHTGILLHFGVSRRLEECSQIESRDVEDADGAPDHSASPGSPPTGLVSHAGRPYQDPHPGTSRLGHPGLPRCRPGLHPTGLCPLHCDCG